MPEAHVLTIVIPALNEEEAIGSTLQRCLDARDSIKSRSNVGEIEIIVVSDGSTDRTEEIAKGFDGVRVLVFSENRGYGAAIKCGFAHGRGDLVSFLDADGTCDPLFFGDMCRELDEQQADVVLGSRMGSDSEMPLVRTIGNTIFAWILGILSKQRVEDTASGMRVIRRAALAHLYPLPDRLHFTPAMSARALIEGRLRVVELPMKYAERVGRSKLSVLKDGVRFLTCILQAAVAYRPGRPLLLAAGLLALAAIVVGAGPLFYYASYQHLQEWMIYRMLLASLLVTSSSIVVGAAVVADRVASLAHGRRSERGVTAFVARLFNRRNRRIGGVLLLVASVALVWPGLVEYASTRHVTMHWSRAALASLLLVLAVTLATTTFLIHMLELIEGQRTDGSPVRPPDREHAPRSRGAASIRGGS